MWLIDFLVKAPFQSGRPTNRGQGPLRPWFKSFSHLIAGTQVCAENLEADTSNHEEHYENPAASRPSNGTVRAANGHEPGM